MICDQTRQRAELPDSVTKHLQPMLPERRQRRCRKRSAGRQPAPSSTGLAARSAAPGMRRWISRSPLSRPFSGPPQASVLGRGERLDPLHAALINGISSHVFDFDDTHLRTVIHPAGPVASALLAFAEHRKVRGPDFVNALVLGIEVECRDRQRGFSLSTTISAGTLPARPACSVPPPRSANCSSSIPSAWLGPLGSRPASRSGCARCSAA